MILGMLFLAYPLYCIGRTKKIHVILAESFAVFFMLYIVVTALLYGIGIYSLVAAELATLFLSLTACGLTAFLLREKINLSRIKFSLEGIVTLVVILIGGGLSVGNYEAYGTGQDQGLYQIEAINILQGKPQWRQNLKEFKNARTYDGEDYRKVLDWYLVGVYPEKENWGVEEAYREYPFVPSQSLTDEDFYGVFHGIPTYPSYLALSAQIFGIKHMAWGNIALFITVLVLIGEMLAYFNVDWRIRSLTLLLLGVCPQIVWADMSTLVEMGITLLLIGFLYFLLVYENEKKQYLAVAAVVAYSVYHVTIYTLMPMFVLIFIGMYLVRNERKYMAYSLVSMVSYWLGFLFMIKMNPRYTLGNYGQLTGPFEKLISPTVFVTLVVILGIAFLALMYVMWPKKREKVLDRLSSFRDGKLLLRLSPALIIILLLLVCFIRIIGIHTMASEDDYPVISTLQAFVVLTGVVILPAVLVFVLTGRIKTTLPMYVLTFTGIWCVLVYAAVMRPQIQYYYYYSRYLTPFIPIILILFALLYSQYKKVGISLLFAAILFCIPSQYFIHANKDDSRMDWDVILDLCEMAEEKFDADTDVYIDSSIYYILYFPLRAYSDANIYVSDVNYMLDTFMEDPEKRIYYIAKGDFSSLEQIEYINETTISEDNLENRTRLFNLPKNYETDSFDISVINMTDVFLYGSPYMAGPAKIEVEEVTCDPVDGEVEIQIKGLLQQGDFAYYNNCEYFLSYHIFDATGNLLVYDNPRYSIGTIVTGEATMNLNLDVIDPMKKHQIKDIVLQIDMVHEGIGWKSYEGVELPRLRFVKTSFGWRLMDDNLLKSE